MTVIDLDRSNGPSWQPEDSGWALGTSGLGWTLFIPEDGNAAACARSAAQTQPKLEQSRDRTSFKWIWTRLRSDSGREHDITVTMTLVIEGSTLRSELDVVNDSDHDVTSAHFPSINGLAVPGGRALRALTRDYYGARWRDLWPRFEWSKGYYGTLRPTLMTDSLVFGNPTAPFTVMSDGIESIAVAIVGPTPTITSWQWELEPGYSDTIGDYIGPDSGAELHFHVVHLLDMAPGERRLLPGVELTHAIGGWPEALTRYRDQRRKLRASSSRVAEPSWAAHPTAWYQVGLNTAAGERRYSFSDVPELARQCASAGVDVLHVIGWNTGGQDRNNPSHDPDPALGGAVGLAAAIDECHKLGVKVVLFAKFTWADQATQRFRDELIASAVRDPYGDYYRNPGYQYLVPHQLLDVSTRRLVPMCFLHEDYIRVCEAEFDKVIATGADGMLFDEAMHHTPALLCYAEDHGHRPGESVYAGDIALANRLRARVPAGREFLFAGETLYEDLQSSYEMSYIRSHYADHAPLTRFVNPELRMLTTVTGFDDRNQINQGVVYGYQFCYEPKHFKGTLHDMPQTVAYGRRADQLRVELAEHLWDGTYLGPVPLDSAPDTPHATARWRAGDGSDVLVLANYHATETARFTITLPVAESRTIDTPWVPTKSAVRVAPRSLMVVR